MFWKRLAIATVGALLLAAPAAVTHAATAPQKDKGLLITPLRQYATVNAGATQKGSFTIANLTSGTITVGLSLKQFSVTDYTYDYRFRDPSNSWIGLGLTAVSLKSDESRAVPYTITVPPGTAPGGHYYTLFASADLSTGGLKSTVQAATLLYLTVNGKLVKTSRVQTSSLQRLSFGKQITYTVEPVDTGNVYYFIYVSGKVHGPFTKPATSPVTHILMPGAVRRIEGSVPSPILPGVYRVSFGYKTDAGENITMSRNVVVIPPWSIAFLLAIILFGARFRPGRKKKSNRSTKMES